MLRWLLAVRSEPYTGRVSSGSSAARRNAAPPGGLRGPLDVLPILRALIVHQQSGVWHKFGHHAGRTLEALKNGVRITELSQVTGYTPRTLTAHLEALEMVRLDNPRTHRPTARALYEAAADLGQAGRPAELAVSARVDEERHRWWLAEQEWCAASRREKVAQGARPDARQAVLPGMDPYARRYPRHPPPAPRHPPPRHRPRGPPHRVGDRGPAHRCR